MTSIAILYILYILNYIYVCVIVCVCMCVCVAFISSIKARSSRIVKSSQNWIAEVMRCLKECLLHLLQCLVAKKSSLHSEWSMIETYWDILRLLCHRSPMVFTWARLHQVRKRAPWEKEGQASQFCSTLGTAATKRRIQYTLSLDIARLSGSDSLIGGMTIGALQAPCTSCTSCTSCTYIWYMWSGWQLTVTVSQGPLQKKL